MQTTHAYDGNGKIVGSCRTGSKAQIAAWEAMGLTTVEGPDIDISLWEYVDGSLTRIDPAVVAEKEAKESALKAIDLSVKNNEMILDVFGQGLTGNETGLQRAKLARIKALKTQMRSVLALEIGDDGDNIADVTRAVVLGEAIRMDLVTDTEVLDAYKAYIGTLLAGYGGEKAILSVLQADLAGLGKHLVGKYYPAKEKIEQAGDEASVEAVEL